MYKCTKADGVVSRTSIRPFRFTLDQRPSKIEILVRTGTILPPKKPSKAEKGLQDISSRDGIIRPTLLSPLLHHQSLEQQQFEPHPTAIVSKENKKEKEEEEEENNPAKDWVEGLNSLGRGTVEMGTETVQIKEIKRIEWRDLRNIVLFRFHCGI